MKLLKTIFSRIFIFGICLVVQFVWYIELFWNLASISAPIMVFCMLLSVLVVLMIVKKDQNPALKIPWIIAILALPLLGGLLYLFLGTKRPARHMRKKLDQAAGRSASLLEQKPEILEELEKKDKGVAGQCRYLNHEGYPVYKNTEATYYPLGDLVYPVMLEELKKAEHFIFMEYFIIDDDGMWNGILKILEEKVRAGVEVRVIYDDVGCLPTSLPADYWRQLEKKGIKSFAFNPFIPIFSVAMNNRDHRKIMVIDGHTAFSGGINLADEYINTKVKYGHWKDNGFWLKGEAVWSYTVMFLNMWNAFRPEDQSYEAFRPNVWHPEPFEGGGYIQPYGDSPLDSEVTGENVYLNIINQAQDYVYIFTPYLIIDNEMITALTLAAKRQVDVRIVTPGIPDKKAVFLLTQSYYEGLIKHGVKIYEYTPGFIHGKCFVADDRMATVGTINTDYRSLYLHFECGTYFYDSPVVAQVKEDFLDTFGKCRLIRKEDCAAGLFKGFFQMVLRVFAPLM